MGMKIRKRSLLGWGMTWTQAVGLEISIIYMEADVNPVGVKNTIK